MNFHLTEISDPKLCLGFDVHSSRAVMCLPLRLKSKDWILLDKAMKKKPVDLQKRSLIYRACLKCLAAHHCGLAISQITIRWKKTPPAWERGMVHCVLTQHPYEQFQLGRAYFYQNRLEFRSFGSQLWLQRKFCCLSRRILILSFTTSRPDFRFFGIELVSPYLCVRERTELATNFLHKSDKLVSPSLAVWWKQRFSDNFIVEFRFGRVRRLRIFVATFILEDRCRSLWVIEVVEEVGLITCEGVVHRHGAIPLIVRECSGFYFSAVTNTWKSVSRTENRYTEREKKQRRERWRKCGRGEGVLGVLTLWPWKGAGLPWPSCRGAQGTARVGKGRREQTRGRGEEKGEVEPRRVRHGWNEDDCECAQSLSHECMWVNHH